MSLGEKMENTILVLIVEDSPIAQKAITLRMEGQGCEVDIANDGVIALEKAMEKQYDLILMDIGLGDGPDGFETTKKIKQGSLNKSTPIMAITSHNEPQYQGKALEYGMLGYFNKPFTEKEAKIVLQALKGLLQ
jgi:CheY-like chemotaxis protein